MAQAGLEVSEPSAPGPGQRGNPALQACVCLCLRLCSFVFVFVFVFAFACWSQRVRLTGVSTASSPVRKGSPDNVTSCVSLVRRFLQPRALLRDGKHRKHARFPLTGGSNLCGCAFNGFYDKPLNQRMNGEQVALQYQPKDDALHRAQCC